MATNSNDKRFFDVSKPGKSPAGATSRPVIVSNRPMLKDPTLKPEEGGSGDATSKEKNEEDKVIKNEAKIVVPIDENLGKDKEENKKEKEEGVEVKVSSAETSEDPDKTPEDFETKEDKKNSDASEKKDEFDNKEKPIADNDQVDLNRPDQKKEAELTEAEKILKEKTDKLITSGRYVVSVGHIKRNRKLRKVLGIVILVLLLGILTIYLLVDAGIIKANIKLPIDLIKN